jgi:hypothetical protein
MWLSQHAQKTKLQEKMNDKKKETGQAKSRAQLDCLRHSRCAPHRTAPLHTLQPRPRNLSRALRIQKQRSCAIGVLVLGAKKKAKIK